MKQKLTIEMTENGIHYTLHGDYYFRIFQPLILIQPSAIMAGCARHIWKSIFLDYTHV